MNRSGPAQPLRTLEHVPGVDPAIVRGFARAAADRIADGPITLDARDRLLRRGERLGLRRFDANLVLAAVEYRHRETHGPMRLTPAGSPPVATAAAAPSRRPVWSAAAAAVVLQGVILTGVWWLLA